MKKPQSPSLYQQINELLQQSRQHIKSSVNQILVQTYWHVGRIIVEEEQGGQHKAEYGAGVLKELAAQLTKDYGKGFDASNLRYMRLFYKAFPNCDALRHELSWTHYRFGTGPYMAHTQNTKAGNLRKQLKFVPEKTGKCFTRPGCKYFLEYIAGPL